VIAVGDDTATMLCAVCGSLFDRFLSRNSRTSLAGVSPPSVALVAALIAAGSYGAVIQAAFDLYRFELLPAMHLPLPRDAKDERRISGAVSRWFSQGLPHELTYDFGGGDADTS
jgi:hypothetical protein